MYKNKISLCSEIIVIIFSYSRSKQTARRHQAIKTRTYLDPVLITLFVSKWHTTPLAQIQKTVDRAHAPCENREFATGSQSI